MRLPAWLKRAITVPRDAERWIVVDVETSGMDSTQDRLLAIGAIAIAGGRLRPGDSFEAVLQQSIPSQHDNILIHGIGVQAQRAGTERATALLTFLDFIADAPLLAFHAPFDRGFLVAALEQRLSAPLENEWLDLAPLAQALVPKGRAVSLDEWLAHFEIPIASRHSAAADAFATALLALRLFHLARAAGSAGLPAMQRTARDVRWIG